MQNQIPKNWQEVKLEDVCLKITDGSHSSPPTVENGLPMASVKDMTPFGLNLETCRLISKDDFNRLEKQDCKPLVGDVLIAKDGATALDTVCLINKEINAVLLSSVAILRPNPTKILGAYLYLYLDNERMKQYMKRTFISGAAIPRVVLKDFKKIELTIPPINDQKKIASILSALNNKIELNNKIAKTLEEMAQMLFKEWFVNFKFPGYKQVEFVDSELGKIPKEWEIGTLVDLVNIRNGFAFKSSDYEGAGVPIVRTMNFNDNGSVELNDMVYLSEETAKKYQSFYLESFDFLLVMVGASVGKWSIVPSNILPALQNQNMWDFMPKKEEYRFFNIYLLKKIIREQKGSTTGSARDFFRKDYFYSLNVFIPDSEILKEFNRLVEPIYKRLDTILSENQKLAALRDLLLPKLMKGEIRV